MDAVDREELKVILKFALHIAKVDDNLAGLERKILKRYVDLIGLTEEERSALKHSDQSLSHELGQMHTKEGKSLLVRTLCAVAHSDGVMHESEGEFITKVNQQLGIPVPLLPFEEWDLYEQEVLTELGMS